MGNVLRKVEEIAAMADTPCERRGDTLVATYHFHDGRDQTVYIIECGETANGMHMIGFFSPCQKLEHGSLAELSKDRAVELLRRNSSLLMGSYCLRNTGTSDLLGVRATQILETMEVEEFVACCASVAVIADSYEREMGQDSF